MFRRMTRRKPSPIAANLPARRSLAALVACCAAAPCAAAPSEFKLEPTAHVPLTIAGIADEAVGGAQGATLDESVAGQRQPTRWGDANTFAFNASLGYADDFDDIALVPGSIGFSWFPVRLFSIDVDAEGAYVSQPGDDSGGAGLALTLRWHFLDFDRWSIYGDLGIGFLALTEPVPQDAASFVFTPRAGLGASFALDEGDTMRLLTGLRWYHISNAQTASENPGVNALEAYVGVSIAF